MRKVFRENKRLQKRLLKRLAAVRTASAANHDHARFEKQFERKSAKLLRVLTDRLLPAVEKCSAAGEPGLGFDLLQHLLRIDPNNRRARRGLGHVDINGRWFRPYDAKQYKKGLVWHREHAWIVADAVERYEGGEYYDLETRRWGKLAEFNEVHGNADTPWVLHGEHFELVSTADLELSAKVLRRLEKFFLQAFRQYDRFFTTRGAKRRAALIFGKASLPKRLKVYFYRDREQFQEHAKPAARWAAGFYSRSKHASFFYADGNRVPVQVLQHEVTHQILGEFSAGKASIWLVEGAAVYLEDTDFEDTVLTVGGLRDNRRLQVYANNVCGGISEHSLVDTMGFKTGDDWDSGDISKNYRGAGAVVYFLMHFDGGRYRGDFVEMLRGSYNGRRDSIENYIGLTRDSLSFLMERFYVSRVRGTR